MQPAKAFAGSHGPTGRRVLIVDDERSLAETLGRLLRSYGHQVSVADEPATAVQMVLVEHPQVVILDIKMRGTDGCEIARQLRGHAQLDSLQLIALSGSCDARSRQRAMAAGFDAYLTKPANITELLEAVAVCSE